MPSVEEHKDVLRRLKAIEDRLTVLEKEVSEHGKTDITVSAEIKSLQKEFDTLRIDVLDTVKGHTDKTWKLIDRMLKIIVGLIIATLVIAGVARGPEVVKWFLGV